MPLDQQHEMIWVKNGENHRLFNLDGSIDSIDKNITFHGSSGTPSLTEKDKFMCPEGSNIRLVEGTMAMVNLRTEETQQELAKDKLSQTARNRTRRPQSPTSFGLLTKHQCNMIQPPPSQAPSPCAWWQGIFFLLLGHDINEHLQVLWISGCKLCHRFGWDGSLRPFKEQRQNLVAPLLGSLQKGPYMSDCRHRQGAMMIIPGWFQMFHLQPIPKETNSVSHHLLLRRSLNKSDYWIFGKEKWHGHRPRFCLANANSTLKARGVTSSTKSSASLASGSSSCICMTPSVRRRFRHRTQQRSMWCSTESKREGWTTSSTSTNSFWKKNKTYPGLLCFSRIIGW